MAKKKKYTIEERAEYHNSRYLSSARYGLEFNGTKHAYSSGFVDGYACHDNSVPFSKILKPKSLAAYKFGQKRGFKAKHDLAAERAEKRRAGK